MGYQRAVLEALDGFDESFHRSSDGKGGGLAVWGDDMDLALRLVDYVSVLNHGRLLVEAEPTAIRINEAVQEVYLGKPHHARRA